MPRSARHNRRDKLKGRSTVKEVLPPEPEPEEEDLIGGRISQAQRMDMWIQEDADETVGEIMDELICKVMEGCYKSYIEKQLVPYTASWAKSHLTKNVECQFLCLDQGEGPEEICSAEDSEPMLAIPDCWAQGCIPTVNAASQSGCTSQQVLTALVPLETEPCPLEQLNAAFLRNCTPKQDEIDKKHRKDERDPLCTKASPSSPSNTGRKKILQVTSPPKYSQRKLPPPALRSTEKKNVEGEGKTRDSVANKLNNTPAHRHKDSQPLPKLDPKRLPQHCIFPQYEIVHNDLTKPSTQKTGGLPRLEAKFQKQKSCTDPILKPPKTTSKEPPERNDDDVCLPKHEKDQPKLFGPLRLDTMTLSKGVSLLDSKAAGRMPLRMNYPPQAAILKPIPSDVTVPLYLVEQVAAGPPPQVTPITQTKNCDS